MGSSQGMFLVWASSLSAGSTMMVLLRRNPSLTSKSPWRPSLRMSVRSISSSHER